MKNHNPLIVSSLIASVILLSQYCLSQTKISTVANENIDKHYVVLEFRAGRVIFADETTKQTAERFSSRNSGVYVAASPGKMLYGSLGSGYSYAELSPQEKDAANGTKPPGAVPKEYTLFQNYPNPFNPSTVITYDVPVTSRVILKVYDVLGREVATLVDGEIEAGHQSVEWNASGVATGMYFYRITAYTFTDTKKLMLVK